MNDVRFIPLSELQRVQNAEIDSYIRLELLADMNRVNALSEVKRAGSGHLGSSFSSLDIVTWLYFAEMNTREVGFDSPDRDIYFSSKGHDVPGLYAVLFALGVIPWERLLKLRRFGGLDGHPDVGTPGIEANSGSLGMGISKGRGMAWAKRFLGHDGRVYVMLGDGELQEGQNFEALQTTAQQRVTNLTVIVDHNKVQSDELIGQIVDLGVLMDKFAAFGWHVVRCDGHDLRQLEKALAECRGVQDKPQIIVADTIKGRGVSFMEHPTALQAGNGLYPWHAGAPNDQAFVNAHTESVSRIDKRLLALGMAPLTLLVAPSESSSTTVVNLAGEPVSQAAQHVAVTKTSDEYVSRAFGQVLVEIGAAYPDMVVLDADLAADCKIRDFAHAYPDRFIENGIAEQDMVSMAGGLARQGLLPVVNSFASFLASRANEQIYNNASELTKIIYVCHYAGLIPAGPGKSHQSIRDISLFGALPNCIILQPCNTEETRQVVQYCVGIATENCAIRLAIGPSPRTIRLPDGYRLTPGHGVTLRDGKDAVLFAYGPVMLHEALLASELLEAKGFGLRVVNMPWLNRADAAWCADITRPYSTLYVLEDHALVGGLGDHLLNVLVKSNELGKRRLVKLGVEGYPACGTPAQALEYHGLDGESLAAVILRQE